MLVLLGSHAFPLLHGRYHEVSGAYGVLAHGSTAAVYAATTRTCYTFASAPEQPLPPFHILTIIADREQLGSKTPARPHTYRAQ